MLFKSIHLRSSNLVCCRLVWRYLSVAAAEHGILHHNLFTDCRENRVIKLLDPPPKNVSVRNLVTATRPVNSSLRSFAHYNNSAISNTHLPRVQLGYFSTTSANDCCPSGHDHLVTPVFLRAQNFGDKVAVVSQHGQYTYNDILNYSAKLVQEISKFVKVQSKKGDNFNPRIAFLCENDLSYVVTQWAVLMAGCVAVPLCKQHPTSELKYFVEDSGASLIIGTAEYSDKVQPIAEQLGVPLMVLTTDDYTGEAEDASEWLLDERLTMLDNLHKDLYKDMPAMFIYTSGTTGRPKGVVVTYGNIDAQMKGMIESWGWTSSDVILHVLPLHHVHGVVNVLMTSLYTGATCKMMANFDAKQTWKILLNQNVKSAPVNVFMAVPTIYAKLIEMYDKLTSEGGVLPKEETIKSTLKKNIRLMVSGSAALPQPVMERWEQITGHTLLERYGMTEIGMALTNPLEGERTPGLEGERTPGAVGNPFPGVEVAIVKHLEDMNGHVVVVTGDSKRTKVTQGYEEESGELMVRGPSVFHQYWNKPEATRDAFTQDGWFKTGDTAVYKEGSYRIVGRTSVDVIKSGGYKISALDVERHLLSHPSIRDVAVVGLPHTTWGQVVAAVMVLKDGHELKIEDMKEWAQDKMIPYHIPKIGKTLDEMPRNAMGKINKKDLVKSVFPEYMESKD